MAKICLITPAHLSTNPRLVKEADALVEAGYDVRVVACQFMDWATRTDKAIVSKAKWNADLLCWNKQRSSYLFWKSRFRQHMFLNILRLISPSKFNNKLEYILLRSYDRVLPELLKKTIREKADLYIAHNLQALPIAVIAAQKYKAKVGFDAEDFHSGMRPYGTKSTVVDSIIEYIERKYLPRCDYITAASPGIAEAYASKYSMPKPTSILNVFPLSQRPQEFRPSSERDPLTLYWFSQTIGTDRGLEDIIQAMGLLQGHKIELHLRGNWAKDYQERLLKFAMSVGVGPEQIYAYNPEPPDEMIKLAAQYDVGLALEQKISKNRDICLTNKIFTYLLAGNAIIATATQGQRLIMQTVKNAGLCFELGNIKRLTEQLRCWYEDRPSLNKARRAAWEWGTRKYNWDIEKKKFIKVIHGLLSERR